jgi:hypothetical protein
LISPSGRLELWRTDSDGQATFDGQASGPNTVVDLARVIMSRLMGGAAPDSFGNPASIPTVTLGTIPIVAGMPELAVARMQWGTDGTPPSATDEALRSPLPLQKPVLVDYLSNTKVQFTATLANADLNGEYLREAVLLTHSGLVFARRVFTPEHEKSYAFTWTFKWTITF